MTKQQLNTIIQGQEAVVGLLSAALSGERLGHAYLFHGPAGVGKSTMARDFARALACENHTGCGSCGTCKRFEHGNYADFISLPTDGASLKIEDTRTLNSTLARSPREGVRKIALIPRAERMTPEAQNALLKTLEAPPAASIMLLTTEALDSLLPTIISRCQLLRCNGLSQSLLYELLVAEGIEEEPARSAAARAEGSLSRARALVGDDNLHTTAQDIWKKVKQGDLVGVYAAAGELGKREGTRELFEELTRLAGVEFAAEPTDAWLTGAVRELNKAGAFLNANTNVRLTAETILGELTLSRPRMK